MSDSSNTIVDIEATPQDAARLADVIRSRLVSEGIVEPEMSDSALGSEGAHRPGPNYRIAIESAVGDPGFLGLMTNGLEIRSGRQIFTAFANGLELRCDACGSTLDLIENSDSAASTLSEWLDACDAWSKGGDQVSFACPKCGQRALLAEWRGPWPWGFGNLGLTFT